MQYLSRSRLPVFTPRLDLTAEDLNAEAETLCAAINELAGRLFIIKDMIPKEERSQYAEEESYPILDEIERIWEDIQRAWETIEKNKEECEAHYEETMARITELDDRLNNLIQAVKQELLNIINAVDKKHDDEEERIENKFDISFSDLEKRFNALDDAAARKADLAKLFDRIQYIQDNSLPKIGADGYWYIGKIRTNTKAQGEPGEGVPKGGKKGQTLIKNSDKDYDTIWGASAGGVTAVTVDEYIAGMEEEIPILVVYKEPHIIDPATDFELKTGVVFTTDYVDEKQYKIESQGVDDMGEYYDIVFKNTDDKATFKHDGISFDAYDIHGDWTANCWCNFINSTGSNLIGPGETSNIEKIRPFGKDYTYLKVNHENVLRGVPQENPESIGNVLVASVGIKEHGDLVHKVLSHIDGIVTMEVTNIHPENKIHIPALRYVFRDYYGFNHVFSEQYNVDLEPGASFICGTYVEDFFSTILDDNYESIAPKELQPYHMVPEVGNEVIAGDYKYKLTGFTIENNASTVTLEATNMLDFAVQPPIGKWSLGFHVFDKYGTPIADLLGYAPNTMAAGDTQEIGSSITANLSKAAFLEFDSTFFNHLDNTVHLIPVAGSKLVTPDGSLELEYISHETIDGTSTLRIKVTNLTDTEVAVDDELVLCDPIGQELITLKLFAGILDAGSSSEAAASYGGSVVGEGLYYIEYRKESE